MHYFLRGTALALTVSLLSSCPGGKQTKSNSVPAGSSATPTTAPVETAPDADSPTTTAANSVETPATGTLAAELAQLKASSSLAPEDQAVLDAWNADHVGHFFGLGTGTPAPMFTLKDSKGEDVVLGRILAKKTPVALIFYRGEWCPYCGKQLEAMQRIYPDVKAAGAELIAICPEKQEFVAQMVERRQLSYPVVSDPGSLVADSYKVAYEVDAALGGLLSKSGVDLSTRNGEGPAKLPYGAVYVIDGEGNIHWTSFIVDYTKRAEPAEVLASLKEAAAKNAGGAGA